MIISISVEELHRLVADKYRLDTSEFGLVITRNRGRKIPAMLENLIRRMRQEEVFAPNIKGMSILPDKMIAAIKCIRTFYQEFGYSCGLDAGKRIMEEWVLYVEYSKKFGFVTNPDSLPWRLQKIA